MEKGFVNLMRGDPAPRFDVFVSGSTPGAAAVLQAVVAKRHRFDDEKICFFGITVDPRIERYLVGCYTAEDGGHFAVHRDNTTRGMAHRRFTISINLRDDFEGGEVSFPEYGPHGFKPPIGGAVSFPAR